jgi:hypothetical protein
MITVTKGITIGEIETQWIKLGGSVVRDRPDHTLFKYPGLAAAAVHSAHTADSRAPRHLVSRFLKLQQGRINAPRPVVEPVAVVEAIKEPRSRSAERPWPAYTTMQQHSGVVSEEQWAAMRAVGEALKAARLRREMDHQTPRIPTEAELAAIAERQADEAARERTWWWVNGISKAEIIVGTGFVNEAWAPGSHLVFYGGKAVMRAAAAGTKTVLGFRIDLKDETPEQVDMWTFLVTEIKGSSDLLWSWQWGRGQAATTPDAVRGAVANLKAQALFDAPLSIVSDRVVAEALQSWHDVQARHTLDLSDGLRGLGIEKVLIDRGYYGQQIANLTKRD